MNRKQFQELAEMLKEHKRTAEYTNEPRRKVEYEMLSEIELSIIGICKRNNPNFDTDSFVEAAEYK